MYGRDVASVSAREQNMGRGKAHIWGSMSIRSLCLFVFLFDFALRLVRGAPEGTQVSERRALGIGLRWAKWRETNDRSVEVLYVGAGGGVGG